MVEAQTPFIAMPHIAKIFPGCIGEPITKNIRFKFTNDHELLIKHNALLLGYIKNGKVKVAVDKNGYFHTNGIAHVIDKNILL
jgi:long-subunit acyl-CoA synthetase (AMP-forming)